MSLDKTDTNGLQASIHYRFGQVKLLETALTHSSFANENGETEDNERLEFLGDAVLELVTSEEAYRRYPEAPEGELTWVRSLLVKERSLAAMARTVDLQAHMLLGRGEEAQGERGRDALLADALEALLGAVFLDGGYEAARVLALRLLEPQWPEASVVGRGKDYKTRLQELTQSRFRARPVYVLAGSEGPEHEKWFNVEVRLPDERVFQGRGTSVKRAEQAAARAAVEVLGGEGG